MPGLQAKQTKKLRKLIGERVTTLPADHGMTAQDRLARELETNVSLAIRSVLVLKQNYGRTLDAEDVELTIESIDDRGRRTDSNLPQLAGFDDAETHMAIERALLALRD